MVVGTKISQMDPLATLAAGDVAPVVRGTFNYKFDLGAKITSMDSLKANLSDLAASSGSSMVGRIRPEAGSVSQTLSGQLNLLPVTLEQFGGVGAAAGATVVDNTAAFNLFRTYHAQVKAADSTAWVVLQLAPGKTYGYTDNTWSISLDRLYVQGNGARLQNIIANGASAYDQDKFALYAGGLGYIEFVAGTNLASKSLTPNSTNYKVLTANATIGAFTVTVSTADAATFAVGDWCIVSDGIAFIGGSPPSVNQLDYVQISAINTGTGVITFKSRLTRNYSTTLPAYDATYRSGDWPAQAKLFKLASSWNVEQVWEGVTILAGSARPEFGAYFFGRSITLRDVNTPGFTFSIADRVSVTGGQSVTPYAYEPVDKLVKSALFTGHRFQCDAVVSGDGSGGRNRYMNCTFDCDIRVHRNAAYDSCTFNGNIGGGYGTNLEFTNCGPIGTLTTIEARPITIDGTSVTVSSNVISIPISTLSGGNGQFLERVKVGCELWRVDPISLTYLSDLAQVTGITKSGSNILVATNSTVALTSTMSLRPPMIEHYRGSGNLGNPMDADNKNGTVTGTLPNGGIETWLGNVRRYRFAGVSGSSLNRSDLQCRGRICRVVIDVQRAYTGVTYGTLFGVIYTNKPAFAEHVVIDLKTVGRREITPLGTSAALGADILTNLKTFVSQWFAFVSDTRAGAPVTLSEATDKLPIFDIYLEVDGGGLLAPLL